MLARDPPLDPANLVVPNPQVRLSRRFKLNCAGPVAKVARDERLAGQRDSGSNTRKASARYAVPGPLAKAGRALKIPSEAIKIVEPPVVMLKGAPVCATTNGAS